MLEDSLIESRTQRKTGKPVTIVVSAVAHIVTIGVLVLIPLVQTQAITIPSIDTSLLAPRMDTLQPVQVFSVQPRVQERIPLDPNVLIAPESIPEGIASVDEPIRPNEGFIPSSRTGIGSLLNNLINSPAEAVAPVAPLPLPPPPQAVKIGPIRQGGNVQAANLIYRVTPIYPPIARQARVQGVVVMEATISKDGSIESLRVVKGHPLLNQAALDAVQQWRYRPTMLNGEPVEVITTITVTFTFQ